MFPSKDMHYTSNIHGYAFYIAWLLHFPFLFSIANGYIFLAPSLASFSIFLIPCSIIFSESFSHPNFTFLPYISTIFSTSIFNDTLSFSWSLSHNFFNKSSVAVTNPLVWLQKHLKLLSLLLLFFLSAHSF